MVCENPFERVEIHNDGKVYTCCPNFNGIYSIGNIFETPFSEIWNGEKVKLFRRKLLNGDYSLCRSICNKKQYFEGHQNITNYNSCEVSYPDTVSISCDESCNVCCLFCREEIIHHKFKQDDIDREINEIWLPTLEGVRIFEVGMNGEPLSSTKDCSLLKASATKYPDLKYHLHTNGILGTERKLRELGIYDRIETITQSMHAATRETYNKIFIKGGNFDRVIENIKLYSKMKEEGILKRFVLVFVVLSETYTEMPDFAQFALENNAEAAFWGLRPTSVEGNFWKKFDYYNILSPAHKDHEKLLEVLRHPIFQEENKNIELFPEIKHLVEKAKSLA